MSEFDRWLEDSLTKHQESWNEDCMTDEEESYATEGFIIGAKAAKEWCDKVTELMKKEWLYYEAENDELQAKVKELESTKDKWIKLYTEADTELSYVKTDLFKTAKERNKLDVFYNNAKQTAFKWCQQLEDTEKLLRKAEAKNEKLEQAKVLVNDENLGLRLKVERYEAALCELIGHVHDYAIEQESIVTAMACEKAREALKGKGGE